MTDRTVWKIGSAGLLAIVLLGVISFNGAQARPLEQVGFDCTAQSAVPVEQCDALVLIFIETNGTEWTNKSGWLSDGNPCNWHGVSCDGGNVVALDLFGNNLTGTLPLEIGTLPNLRTLTINDNPLSGPVPLTITLLDLDLFHFHGTQLCEPGDPSFQDWFSQIVYRLSSGIQCSPPPTPTSPQSTAETQSSILSSTSDVLWPHQTLTAMAAETIIPTRVLSPTPTKYYSLPTRTPTPAVTATPTPAVMADDGGNFFSRIFGGIPRFYYFLMVIPLLLIVVGVFLELRQRGVSEPSFECGEDISEHLYKLDYYDPNEEN
ncbi:MAG: hypothetical protein P8Y68_19295 [Anaerolineales bacterium]